MIRADGVVVPLPGDYGKSRPALVFRSSQFTAHPSVTLMPINTDQHHLIDAPCSSGWFDRGHTDHPGYV